MNNITNTAEEPVTVIPAPPADTTFPVFQSKAEIAAAVVAEQDDAPESLDPMDMLEEIANKIGGELRPDYSGRGMYGKTCVGIVCDNPHECIEAAVERGIKRGRVDNMGLDYIVYWPHITAPADEVPEPEAPTSLVEELDKPGKIILIDRDRKAGISITVSPCWSWLSYRYNRVVWNDSHKIWQSDGNCMDGFGECSKNAADDMIRAAVKNGWVRVAELPDFVAAPEPTAIDYPQISPGFCPGCGELADLYDASTNRALCTNGHSHAVPALVRTVPAPRLAWRKARDYDRLLSIAAEVDACIDAYEPPARRRTVNIPHAIPTPELLGCRVAR